MTTNTLPQTFRAGSPASINNRASLLAALAALGAVSASAQATWTGTASQDWNDAANWSSAPAAPTGNFTINTATGNYPVLGADSTLAAVDITIGSGGASGRLDHTAGLLSAGSGNWSFVGNGGGSTGVYNLSGSASFTSGRLLIAQAGSTGTVNMNTTGTLTANAAGGDWWNSSGILVGVDNGSNATLNLQAGTITTTGSNANLWVGGLGGTGTLNQTGGTINVAGTLSLARYWGSGTMNITSATVNAGGVNLSHAGAAVDLVTGVMNLNNGGTLNSEGDMNVGFAGNGSSQGTLNVNAGGVLNVASTEKRWLVVNRWDTAKGVINVNGGTINLNTNTDLIFSAGNAGSTGASVVTLSGGAITSYSGNGVGGDASGVLDLNRAGGAAADNTFNLDGGVLTIAGVITTSNNGTATFNFNGGTLRAANASATFLDLGGASQTAVIKAGGALIDTNGYDVTISQALLDGTGGGGLTKNGLGTLSLTGANTFTGDILVNAGTLSLSSAFIDDAASVSLITGSVLNLNYVGADTIGSFFVGGAPTLIGTYGGIGSGADYELAVITGTGWLNVTASAIPEPSSFAALAGLAGLALAASRRRRA